MAAAPLPRSTPAEQDVASSGVTAFLDAIEAADDIELHSLMLLRHGYVVAEGWWAPYRPGEVHLLYSLSKTFTATAAGLAQAEGLLSFDDLVVDHLPELADAVGDPRTAAMRIRDLAAMATGHCEDTIDRAFRLDPEEPVRGFLSLPPEQEPGSVFCYNNGASYTLGAIVQRVTGQTLTAYLQPRLFDPLGIDPPFWQARPAGRELGYSGLHLTTEAVARFGQLYLDDGVWQGVRLLPEGWVAEASRLHTANPDEPNPDWQQGYGYQVWRARHGYRGDGAYGQFCVVLPEQDAVLVTTAQTYNMQGMLDAVWAHLLPAFGTTTFEHDDALASRLQTLTLPPGEHGLGPSDLPEAAADVVVERADPDAEGWQLTLGGDQELTVLVGQDRWRQTRLRLLDGRELVVVASGRTDEGSLVVQLVFLHTPHRLTLDLDLGTGSNTARWQTVPLPTVAFAELALGPRTDPDGRILSVRPSP